MQLYLDAFHVLGLCCSFAKFESSDKSGFIRAFWRECRKASTESATRTTELQMLFLIVSMALDFSVLDPRLLGQVLLRFLALANVEKSSDRQMLASDFDETPATSDNKDENSSSSSRLPCEKQHAKFEHPQVAQYVRTFLFALFSNHIADVPFDTVSKLRPLNEA